VSLLVRRSAETATIRGGFFISRTEFARAFFEVSTRRAVISTTSNFAHLGFNKK
jgi:hypothetical protein